MTPNHNLKSLQQKVTNLLSEVHSDDRLKILRRVKWRILRERAKERERIQYGLSMQEVGLLLGVNRNSMPAILAQFGVTPVRGPRRGLYVTEAQFQDLRARRRSHIKEKRKQRRSWMQPRTELIAMLRQRFEQVLDSVHDRYNHELRLWAFNEVRRDAPKRLQRLIVYVRRVPSLFNPDTMQRRGELAVVLSRTARIERLLERSRCDRSLFYSASSKIVSLEDPLPNGDLTLLQVTAILDTSPLEALIEQEKIAQIVERLSNTRGISLTLARELIDRCLEGE